MYTCLHAHAPGMYTHTYIPTYMHACMHACIYVRMYIHTCIHTYMGKHIIAHTDNHEHMHTDTLMQTKVHISKHTYASTAERHLLFLCNRPEGVGCQYDQSIVCPVLALQRPTVGTVLPVLVQVSDVKPIQTIVVGNVLHNAIAITSIRLLLPLLLVHRSSSAHEPCRSTPRTQPEP